MAFLNFKFRGFSAVFRLSRSVRKKGAIRKRHRQFNEEGAVVVKQDRDRIVKAQKVIDPENNEVLLYCHSARREKKEQAVNDRFTIRFEEALNSLESGLHKKRCLKKYDKVSEKTGRLKQRYSRAAKHYNIKTDKDEKSGNAVKIHRTRKSDSNTKDGLPGIYCLRTSHKEFYAGPNLIRLSSAIFSSDRNCMNFFRL